MINQLLRLCLLNYLLCSLGASTLFSQNTNNPDAWLKVMSYNIRNAKGMDNITNYARIADVILKCAPDVVAIQEVDSVTRRSKGVDVLDTLARLTHMYKTYGASIDYDGGKYGIAILSKQKPLSAKRLALPGREEARSLLLVEFAHYAFCCTHLSLTNADRLASVSIITAEASRLGKPVLLAGDINAEPESEVLQALQQNWQLLSDANVVTFPANAPNRTIDYIFGYKANINWVYHVVKTEVGDEPLASDHLPLVVDVELKMK